MRKYWVWYKWKESGFWYSSPQTWPSAFHYLQSTQRAFLSWHGRYHGRNLICYNCSAVQWTWELSCSLERAFQRRFMAASRQIRSCMMWDGCVSHALSDIWTSTNCTLYCRFTFSDYFITHCTSSNILVLRLNLGKRVVLACSYNSLAHWLDPRINPSERWLIFCQLQIGCLVERFQYLESVTTVNYSNLSPISQHSPSFLVIANYIKPAEGLDNRLYIGDRDYSML